MLFVGLLALACIHLFKVATYNSYDMYVDEKHQLSTGANNMVAALGAGAATTIFTNPL